MICCLLISIFSGLLYCPAQIKILAHNDYQKPKPLVAALDANANIIEADVFSVGSKILVGHDEKDLVDSMTLDHLYLKPLAERMLRHNGHLTADTSYHLTLMIDVKRNFQQVMRLLIDKLQQYGTSFDISKNPHAVKIVISGDRGEISQWAQLPPYIFFDGRPFEQYDSSQLARVAFISDNYWNYVKRGDTSRSRLISVIRQNNQLNKPSRFWAAPDTDENWSELARLGVEIISTDKVSECKKWLASKNSR